MGCAPSPLQLLPRMSAVLLLLLLSAGNAGSQPDTALPRRRLSCVRCCGPSEQPVSLVSQRSARMSAHPQYSLPKIQPTIDITILKGGCSSLFLAALPWSFPTAKFHPKFKTWARGVPKVPKIRSRMCPKCGCAQNKVKGCPNVPQSAQNKVKWSPKCSCASNVPKIKSWDVAVPK